MLDRCFKNLSIIRHLRDGHGGPYLDGFAEALLARGYSVDARQRHVHAADRVSRWAARCEIPIADLDEALLARFARAELRRRRRDSERGGNKRLHSRIDAFLRYLRAAGVVTTSAAEARRPQLVIEHGAWMRNQLGLSPTTIAHSLPVVQKLLDTVDNDDAEFDAVGVRGFVLEYIQQHAPASAGCVTTIVRRFLRWLVVQGRCSADLVEAVPTVPTWRLAKLPRYLPDADVERIIESCNRPSGMARRDRAMVLLLARLGLRASDVVRLRLDDIEWERGSLRVVGKGRREARLPLPQDAGDAIHEYLRVERPVVATDYVFLATSAPIRPIDVGGLRSVVSRLIERAGIQASSRGAHLLRHSLATRMLREGATLDTIGAVLRHRDVNTTAIYAKVDIGLLQGIALPWPSPCAEVSSC